MRKRNWSKYNQDLVKRGSITFVEAKHLAKEKMVGENKFPFQKKIEIKPEEAMALKVTTSELEGVR